MHHCLFIHPPTSGHLVYIQETRSPETNSQVVNAKEEFLKEIKNAIPTNTQKVRKQNTLFLLIWRISEWPG